MNGTSGVPKIMVFRPTWEEFKDFNKYIAYMESCGAHKAGLAKVIPPPEWNPCPGGYDFDKIGDMVIPAPICQVVNGKQGLYQQLNIQKRATTVREFKKMAESTAYCTPSHFDFDDLERKYWRNITYVSPIYGADVSGSLTDPTVKEWNINELGSILDFVSQDYEISIEGVNTAYLYFGMWKTSFAWHTEDMDLYSINYLHFGAPKSWYSIPPDHGPRLERCANGYFSSYFKECPAFLRHKMTIISPQILKNYSIPCLKITQEAGEFMVTFPYGYHAGFNHGYNCAESTNFASHRWIEYGKRAVQCYCRDDMVRISMDTFVKRFQPEKYDLWIQGRDIGSHPNNPSRVSAANAPSIDDILCNKNNKSTVPEIFFKAQVPKRKAKRHLIHKPRKEETDKTDDKVEEAIREEASKEETIPTADAEPSTAEATCPEEETPDEQTVEFMKDIWYKAGEMNDEELDALEAEEPKKKGSKGRKPKSTAAPAEVKLKRLKTEPTIKRIRKTSTETGNPSSVPAKAKASAGLKKTTAPLPEMLNQKPLNLSFKIPKKTLHEQHRAGSESPEMWRDPHFGTPGTEASTLLWTMHHMAAHGRRDSGSIVQKDFSDPAEYVPPEPLSTGFQWSQPGSSNGKVERPEPTTSSQSADLLDPSTWVTNAEQQECESSPDRFSHDDSDDPNKKRSRKQKSPRSNRGQPERFAPSSDDGVSSSASWLDADRCNWTLAQESDYNLYQSLHEPFCCVCALVCSSPSSMPCSQWRQQADAFVQPTSSHVRVPEALFTRTNPDDLIFDQLAEPLNVMSTLYRCSTCRICVHGKCYGIPESTPSQDWFCRRCERYGRNAVCCLCHQKGGALKATSNNRWAHIVCVLSIPEAYFGFCKAREPAVVIKVNVTHPERSTCVYCGHRDDSVCVHCSAKRCSAAYHVTCALDAGVKFTPIKGTVQNTCLRHLFKKSESAVASAAPVSLCTKVWAKHPTYGRYFQARVTEEAVNMTFYWVDFSDGTTSKDTYPEDILNYRCTEDGPPPLGAAVHVQWTDGKAYDGIYRGTIQRQVYKATFKDATTVSLERSEFYLLNESLPKKVRDLLTEVLETVKTDPGEYLEQQAS